MIRFLSLVIVENIKLVRLNNSLALRIKIMNTLELKAKQDITTHVYQSYHKLLKYGMFEDKEKKIRRILENGKIEKKIEESRRRWRRRKKIFEVKENEEERKEERKEGRKEEEGRLPGA